MGLYYVFYYFYVQVCNPKTGIKSTPPHRPTATATIIKTIKAIAPPHHPPDISHLAAQTIQLSLHVQSILCQPLELPCRALVCTTCMVRWFEAFSCINVKCPCCFMDVPLLLLLLQHAPPIIWYSCMQDIFDGIHTC